MLDCPVADTAIGIQSVGFRQRTRRTGFEAPGTTATEIGYGEIRLQLQAEEQLSQQKPRTRLLTQEHGVLAEDSDSGPAGELTFQDRSGIDIGSRRTAREASVRILSARFAVAAS